MSDLQPAGGGRAADAGHRAARRHRSGSRSLARSIPTPSGSCAWRRSMAGSPAPRLLSGPEQDLVLRELIDGDLERGHRLWPVGARPALRTRGFAAELRDLLLRAVERGAVRTAAGRARPPAATGRTGSRPAPFLQRVPGRDRARSARRVGPGGAHPGRRRARSATTRRCSPPSAAGAGASSSTSIQDTDPGAGRAAAISWPTAPTNSSSSATRTSRSTPSAEPTRPRFGTCRAGSAASARPGGRRCRRAAAAGPGPAGGHPPDRGAACPARRGSGRLSGRVGLTARRRSCRRAPDRAPRRPATWPRRCAARTSRTACPGRGWPCWCAPPRTAPGRAAPRDDQPPGCRWRSRGTDVPLAEQPAVGQPARRLVLPCCAPTTLHEDAAEGLLLGPIGGPTPCSCAGCDTSCTGWPAPASSPRDGILACRRGAGRAGRRRCWPSTYGGRSAGRPSARAGRVVTVAGRPAPRPCSGRCGTRAGLAWRWAAASACRRSDGRGRRPRPGRQWWSCSTPRRASPTGCPAHRALDFYDHLTAQQVPGDAVQHGRWRPRRGPACSPRTPARAWSGMSCASPECRRAAGRTCAGAARCSARNGSSTSLAGRDAAGVSTVAAQLAEERRLFYVAVTRARRRCS